MQVIVWQSATPHYYQKAVIRCNLMQCWVDEPISLVKAIFECWCHEQCTLSKDGRSQNGKVGSLNKLENSYQCAIRHRRREWIMATLCNEGNSELAKIHVTQYAFGGGSEQTKTIAMLPCTIFKWPCHMYKPVMVKPVIYCDLVTHYLELSVDG